MKYSLRLEPSLQGLQKLESRGLDKVIVADDYWRSHERNSFDFEIDGTRHEVEYTLVPRSFLNSLSPGEKFGGYIGSMIFINSEVARNNPEWVPYVAFKLHMEDYVDQGLDVSGKVKHWQSLLGTMRLAGVSMPERDIEKFIYEIGKNEMTGHFDALRESHDEFISRYPGGLLDAKRDYLTKHRNNRWVKQGRLEESLASSSLGVSLSDGFRNHSQAVMDSFESGIENTYEVASFLNAMQGAEVGERVIIVPPYNSIAYAMTKEANGKTDLVEFHDDDPNSGPGVDVISKLGGQKYKTWEGLLRRVSTEFHLAELEAGEQVQKEKEKLEGVVYQIGEAGIRFDSSISQIRGLIDNSKTRNLAARISELGDEYSSTVVNLQIAAERQVDRLSALETLRSELKEAI